jgi:hypothetical protein
MRKEGMVFSTVARCPKDANVIVKGVEDIFPARILSMFVCDREQQHSQLYAVIERHIALSDTHKESDPYAPFGFTVAGSLFYNDFHPMEVVNASRLVTLFAKTVLPWDRIACDVVHVLPLFKVRTFNTCGIVLRNHSNLHQQTPYVEISDPDTGCPENQGEKPDGGG